ncbi:component of SufBCD complex [Maritimibacter sp. UBA3975]|uniref:component of SufBCD complex n=1 Tax=Maritimibacter sp. UBA3975 TaxID=1946833 RepID=UPI000C0AD6DF|nr:component of SufBCD complex [Maritimibacter sp. UBA3975]MAM62410.1 component of SufBCD complex [Maritimibacter sp.]|tara:strand:- start:35487 stop:36056 length:570 start_codon:yes stop_codon:yes gene_type:complete
MVPQNDPQNGQGSTVDWYSAVFELIDMRSFSNLWYWIALAAVWSQTSRYVLGVPYDMIQRASRNGGDAEVDLEDMVRINCNRLLYVAGVSGLWIIGIGAMLMTTLAMLGFYYDVEFAQAVFLLGAPMIFVGALSVNSARVIRDNVLSGQALRKYMHRHRIATQFIGMIAIFITALWGMYQNMTYGALGQ